MQLDPDVNRQKFEEEIGRLVKQRAVLESKGIFLLQSSTYPVIDLLFVPKHSVQAVVPTAQVGSSLLQQITMRPLNVPAFSARAFKAHFDLSDYDLRAPSLEFRDAWNDGLLQYSLMPLAYQFDRQRGSHLVLIDNHPVTHKPFLCMRGIREYHEHPQHSGDEWLLYRGTMNLFSIVMSLWRVMIDLVHPQLVFQPSGLLTTNWLAEEKH